MKCFAKLLVSVFLALAITSCVTEPPQEGEEGELVVGYIDEFGTSVARYALDGECHCTSTGFDDDCEYIYPSASEICNVENLYYDEVYLHRWEETQGHIEYTHDAGALYASCSFAFDYSIFASGEMSIKVYGNAGVYMAVKQLSVVTGAARSVGDCLIGGSSYGSCIITGIDPNEVSGYLFLVGDLALTEDEDFLGVRICYDDDASD